MRDAIDRVKEKVDGQAVAIAETLLDLLRKMNQHDVLAIGYGDTAYKSVSNALVQTLTVITGSKETAERIYEYTLDGESVLYCLAYDYEASQARCYDCGRLVADCRNDPSKCDGEFPFRPATDQEKEDYLAGYVSSTQYWETDHGLLIRI